jgi:hypothetical protein
MFSGGAILSAGAIFSTVQYLAPASWGGVIAVSPPWSSGAIAFAPQLRWCNISKV